jgi:hypothetical protein
MAEFQKLPANRACLLNDLPDEIVSEIFCLLGNTAISKVALVNKRYLFK